MLHAYREIAGHLQRQSAKEDLAKALWIDLYSPQPEQSQAVAALGIDVPSLADMEEIEISNRLYREGGVEYMTVVLPGHAAGKQVSAPVTFILSKARLVTVRHHAPRPFETYPDRADKAGLGCHTPDQVFLGLIEEIIGRQADLLEGTGKALDEVSLSIFGGDEGSRGAAILQAALQRVGREGDLLGKVRLALLTIERAVSFFSQTLPDRPEGDANKAMVKGLSRDIQALEVHADFLANRVGLASDATLGMINLAQNSTVRIVSVVAVLFLPPTLIASIYGMNFKYMPELSQSWGYPAALGLMLASATFTYLFFKWKKWL
ncbi:MAG: magnesium transporter CorA family protein [Paracoccaceae bacterium]